MRWQWFRGHVDTTDEAKACLRQLEKRDAKIIDLSTKLREAQRRNHFSLMVDEAIMRAREI